MVEEYPEVSFLKHIIDQLTGDPDCYIVARSIDERGVLLHVTVSQPQAGRIIGRQGVTATALRNILRPLGVQHDARYSLVITVLETA
jgi:predicted RNA-binding protein YlqC (UPF0109 family)